MRKFLTSALARGLLWQLAGWLVGAAFVTGIRLLLGLRPLGLFFFTEPAWVFGGFVGVLAFVAGSRIADDWSRWARGQQTPEHREDPSGWEKYIGVSLDHKVIGIQYTITSLLLLVVGGSFALVFRTELSATGLQFLSLQWYNTFMSLHGIGMIIGILLGVAGVINYLV
ncbi:MAG: cbb3-type cytochrome c oxidase subunit I, partial [Chloroflexota bacterium]